MTSYLYIKILSINIKHQFNKKDRKRLSYAINFKMNNCCCFIKNCDQTLNYLFHLNLFKNCLSLADKRMWRPLEWCIAMKRILISFSSRIIKSKIKKFFNDVAMSDTSFAFSNVLYPAYIKSVYWQNRFTFHFKKYLVS